MKSMRQFKTTFLFVISVLIISSCTNSDNKTMDSQASTVNDTKQSSPPGRKEFETGYAPVNGLKMYYEIHGTGMPLVLIHGGGSTIHSTFGRVLPEFAKTRKVIAVEMQAHGHTADIDRPLSFKQDADDIAALLKHLKIDKSDIFGFSNGASTTLEFAIRHPEMTNKIIVASTFYKKAGAPDWFWKMFINPSFEEIPQGLKDEYLRINPDTNALYRMYERDVARMQSFPEFDISDTQIKSIKAPAFIILGDKDVATPEHAVEMHHLISNSRLAIIPGGHGDYIGEITGPQDSLLIAATVSMLNKFLAEPLTK